MFNNDQSKFIKVHQTHFFSDVYNSNNYKLRNREILLLFIEI